MIIFAFSSKRFVVIIFIVCELTEGIHLGSPLALLKVYTHTESGYYHHDNHTDKQK